MSNKENFVVRNGLEVADGLLFADIATGKVGIGTTQVTELLTVAGGIGATNVSVAQTLTAYISSFTSLKVSGISSLGNVTIGNGTTDLVVNGTTRFSGIVTVGSGSSAITFNPNTDTISSKNVNISGILSSTTINVGTAVTLNSSGVTASNFYGDGSGLYGVVNAGGMTIYYNGSPVGYAATILDFTGSGISTVPFSSGIATVTVNLPSTLANLTITGVATAGFITATNLYVSGVTTTNSLNIGSTEVISSSRQLKNIDSLDATTTTTIENVIANSPNTFSDLNITGISTLGTVRVSSGIVTATSGVVTYYGDGSKLTGLAQQGIGIQSAGTVIGTGITQLNFIGGGNTFAVNGNSVDISISGLSTQWTTVTGGIVTTTKVGIGTTNPRYIFEVGPVGTSFTMAYINGDLNADGIKVFGNGTFSGIVTASSFVGNVVGTSLSVSGISTFANGPILVGAATSTGTASQRLQVTGGAYISGNTGIGTTIPRYNLEVGPVGSSTTDLYVNGDITARFLTNTSLNNYSEKINALGSVSGITTINLSNGVYVTATLAGITTFSFVTGISTGAVGFSLQLTNGTGGPFTITWPASVKWPNNSVPTRTTTDSKTDFWVFTTPNNGTTWYGNLALYNFS